MIPVSSTIKTACDSDKVVYKEYIIIDGNTVEIKGKMSNTCYKNGNIFGTFNLKKLEFETENDIDYKKKEVVYYKSVNGESFKIGTYIVTEVKDNDSKETVSVTAMDYGLKFAIPYVSTLDYTSGTITLFDVLNEACTNAGVSLANATITNGDFIVDSNQFVNGELIGDVVCAVSQMSGDFATINEDDELELVFQELTQETDDLVNLITEDGNLLITEDGKEIVLDEIEKINDYIDLDDKRDTQPFTSVSLGFSDITGEEITRRDLDLIAEYGEHWLNINDNPFAYSTEKMEELIDEIFNKIKGFSYSSFVSKYSFKPYLQLGDVIKFQNKNGYYVRSRILKIDTDYDNITLSAPSIIDATIEYVQPETAMEVAKRADIKVNQANAEIVLKVQDDGTIAKVELGADANTGSEITIEADQVNIEGVINAINDNTTTTIDGDKIRAGSIESNNYLADTSGLKIDLTNGTYDSKNVKINDNGVQLNNGATIVGDNGLLTLLTFPAATGDTPLGWWYDGTNVINEAVNIAYTIPDNFVIVNAYVSVYHIPCYTNTSSGYKWGYSRAVKLYSLNNTGLYFQKGFGTIQLPQYGEITSSAVNADGTSTNAFGSSGWTASVADGTTHNAEFTNSSNISTRLTDNSSGMLIVKSSSARPTTEVQVAEQTGQGFATLNVIGYYKI